MGSAEKLRLARNIKKGMEVQVPATGEWLRVEQVLHISAPLKVSSFRLSDGTDTSAHPQDQIMSRPGGA